MGAGNWDRRMRRVARKRVRNRVLLGVGRGLIGLLGRMEPESASRVGEVVGRLAYTFVKPARQRVFAHLAIAFGDSLSPAARRRLALGTFRNVAANAFEWAAWLPRGPKLAVASITEIVGEEHFVRAREAGKGVVGITAHFGLFELLPVWIFRRISVGAAIGRRPADSAFDDFVVGNRARMGVRTIPQTAAREILRILKDGGLAGILPDQDIDKLPGLFVPFFGRDAWTPTGPASVAATSGAPVIPFFLYREGPARHRLVIHPPIPDPGGPKQARVRAITTEINRLIESVIRERPEQWAWFHERWQTTPERLEARRARRARIKERRRARKAGG
jgi:KDO2-lipid IV(A) lauroyltransferase